MGSRDVEVDVVEKGSQDLRVDVVEKGSQELEVTIWDNLVLMIKSLAILGRFIQKHSQVI